jgi:hypothetical protein
MTDKPLETKDVLRTALPLIRAGVCSEMRELGVNMRFSATEAELIRAGVLLPNELPGSRRGASRRVGDVRAGRCVDGRITVIAYANRAAKLDLGFQDFMHGLLADTQLSIVKHEKPDAYR